MRKKKLYLHETSTLFKLTGPLVLAQLSQTAMGVVDTVMAGRVSPVALAGVAVGSSIFFPLFLFMLGLVSVVMPMVAQANGRGDQEEMRVAIQQGMAVGLVTGLILMVPLWNITVILHWMQVDPVLVPLVEEYLHALSYGCPVAGLFLALRNGGDGIARPRLSMLAGFIGLGVNIVANYTLIYGKFGAPKLGAVGCGWATSLSLLAMFLAMAVMLRKNPHFQTKGLYTRFSQWSTESLKSLIILGLPLGVSLFIECSSFAVISLLVSRLGAELVAAHQIALNFSSLAFMMPYSLSIALTVRVGFAIGKRKKERVLRTVLSGTLLAVCCASINCLVMLLCAQQIAALYTPDPIVQQLAAGLLFYAALFQLPDALQVNFAGALRGCKDTKVPMVLLILAYWIIGIPIGYLFGLGNFFGMAPGPQGFWIGLIFGLTSASILLGRRLYLLLTTRI